jgi:hypothetical protein
MNPALIPILLALAGRVATSPQTMKVAQQTGALATRAVPAIEEATPVIRGATPKMIQSAIGLLKNRLQPEDVNTIGQFAEKVEKGQDKGNLGDLGKTMQSLTTNVFGQPAANWSNKQIKNAFDLVVKGVAGGTYQ